MRVIATLTVGSMEARIEGDSTVFESEVDLQALEYLEDEGIGFWLDNWYEYSSEGKPHKRGRVFVPWTSCLHVEVIGGK